MIAKLLGKSSVHVKPVGEQWGVYQTNIYQSFVDDLRFGVKIAISNFFKDLFWKG